MVVKTSRLSKHNAVAGLRVPSNKKFIGLST